MGDDEEEIDLEIDQLDTVTQRKLQRFIMKVSMISLSLLRSCGLRNSRIKFGLMEKEYKATQKKRSRLYPKRNQYRKKQRPHQCQQYRRNHNHLQAQSLWNMVHFLPLVRRETTVILTQVMVKFYRLRATVPEPEKDEDDFNLGDAHDDDDDNDDLGNGSFGGNWSMATSEPATTSAGKDIDDEDWGAAREQAEVAKARDAERKAREEKLRIEAEQAKNQRLADAAARGEEVRAQREEAAAIEARLREQKEKEALDKKKAARDAERAKLLAVKQTVGS